MTEKTKNEPTYLISETGMNMAIAGLKSSRQYDLAESVLKEINGPVAQQAPATQQSEIQMLQNLDAHLYAKQQEHDAALIAQEREKGE